MIKRKIICFICLMVISFSGYAQADDVPPRVIETNPLNGERNVDPSLKELTVTFSEPMMDGNWSWCYENKETFPIMRGQPYYTDNATKNHLSVKLEPNKEYVI